MANPLAPSAVIFDLDGTLVDSMGGFAQIASDALVRFWACDPQWAAEQYKETSGLPFPFQLEKIFPNDPKNRDAVAYFDEEKRKAYKACPFFPEVRSALENLKAKGVRLAISSNNDQRLVEEKAAQLGFDFDRVLGYRPGFLKGRDHFRWIEHTLKTPPPRMLFVGDSLHDGRMAQEYDIAFIARLGTFSRADFEGIPAVHHIKNFTTLHEIVEDLLKHPLRLCKSSS